MHSKFKELLSNIGDQLGAKLKHTEDSGLASSEREALINRAFQRAGMTVAAAAARTAHSAVSLSALLLSLTFAGTVCAQTDSYTVQRGDSLWSIAADLKTSPVCWREIWQNNLESIKNPHRIRPGQALKVLAFNSTGPDMACQRLPAKPTETISANITSDLTLKADKNYFIDAEVHVLSGVALRIEDGVTILLKNGAITSKTLNRAALVFNPGAKLDAKNVFFRAANSAGQLEKLADNGGVWFLGSLQQAAKDGVVSQPSGTPSSFSASLIAASYLGSHDANFVKSATDPTAHGDDLDALSVLGVGPTEWQIDRIHSEFSGDDGFDLTNSHIRVQAVSVFNPLEDGLNISSSRLEIGAKLNIDMKHRNIKDRDIFDLEVDNGPSYVVLHSGVEVNIRGIFGNEVKLNSKDLHQPDPCDCRYYRFKARTRSAKAGVFANKQD